MRNLLGGAFIALSLVGASTSVQAQGGNLAAPPATNLDLNITGTGPTLSATEFQLQTGKYYRVNLTSDGAGEFMFQSPELLSNAHMRLLVINDIEVHMQSLIFRGIEFDAGGTASFTLVPIRPGNYEFTVGDAKGTFVVQ